MPKMIQYQLRATYNAVRKYNVIDQVCEGNSVFDGFLAEDETVSVSSCAIDEGSDGRISCQRSDGPLVLKDVSEGDIVDLD